MAEKKEFKITPEEAARIQRAMKDEEFRELLTEYAQEISSPENRARYERELTELERQRGVNLHFIRPTPGFVIKIFTKPEGKKVFVNLCQNENVNEAAPTHRTTKGDEWMLPYSLTPPRDDLDKAGKKCCVIDAVFNPQTYMRGQLNPYFKRLLVDTVLEGIETNLHMTFDYKSIVYLRMPYKGVPTATVIREKTKNPYAKNKEGPDLGPGLKVPYPPLKEEVEAKKHKNQQKKKEQEKPPSEPKYNIVHRGEVSMQDFTNERSSSRVKRPSELVVTVHLPGVESAKNVELEIFEKRLLLQCSKPLYKLDLALSYPINEDRGSAKFNKSKKSLVITLPVLPLSYPPPVAPPTRPLVSELSSTDASSELTNITAADKVESHDNKEAVAPKDVQQEDLVGVVQEVTKDWSSKQEWLTPPFSYRQDDNAVFFVLYTSGVKKSSMVSHFEEHEVQLTYNTTSGQNYAFSVNFPSWCGLDCDDCSVDITDENMVVVLAKNDDSSGKEWEDFTVGFKGAQPSEKLFLTTDNVKRSIEQMDEPWDKRNGWSDSAQFQVTSLSSEHMDVKVTDPERSQELSSSSTTSVGSDRKHNEEAKDRAERVSRSPPSVTQRMAQSPSTGSQVHNKSMPGTTKLGSESPGGKSVDSSVVSGLDAQPQPQAQEERTKAAHSVASSTAKCDTNSTGVQIVESQERDSNIQEVNHKDKDIKGKSYAVPKTEKEDNKCTASGLKEGGQCESAEPSRSSLSVENDGSVFVRADKDYTQIKPLEQIAKAQEKGTKIQFSNQLAFSLD